MLLILTLLSTSLALVMSVVAWRATSEQRRRSEARVAALAAEIHGFPAEDLVLRDARSAEAVALQHARSAEAFALQEREPSGERQAAPAQEMFAATQQPPSASRYGVALAAAAFAVASIAAAVIVFSGGPRTAAPAESGAQAAVVPNARGGAPLELVALSHERVGNTLTVRGIVRNPAEGSPMDRLTVVVYLFDGDGGFVASGRAAVESPSLIPAGESTFAVTIPVTADVARYRVSFRSGDRVVAHLDKRTRS